MAEAAGLRLAEAELDRIVLALTALEASFGPLRANLKPEIEPAVLFFADPRAEPL